MVQMHTTYLQSEQPMNANDCNVNYKIIVQQSVVYAYMKYKTKLGILLFLAMASVAELKKPFSSLLNSYWQGP